MTVSIIELPTAVSTWTHMELNTAPADWFRLHHTAKAVEQLILSLDRYHFSSSLTSRLQIEERLLGNYTDAYK